MTPEASRCVTRDQAIERAAALARAEIDKLDNPE
jgi:hypothetical protein